jgi:hypothetical protein
LCCCQAPATLRSFVAYFSSELLSELWARSERARGNLSQKAPDASWKDAYNLCIGLASLIPIPGAAAAFMASCKIGKLVMTAIDAYQKLKDTKVGEVLFQVKDTALGLKEWKEGLDAARGVGSAGEVDTLSSAIDEDSGAPQLL